MKTDCGGKPRRVRPGKMGGLLPKREGIKRQERNEMLDVIRTCSEERRVKREGKTEKSTLTHVTAYWLEPVQKNKKYAAAWTGIKRKKIGRGGDELPGETEKKKRRSPNSGSFLKEGRARGEKE